MGINKLYIIALVCSCLIVWLLTGKFIPVLKRLNFGQAIREEGPQSHLKKSGTPTMGGIVIIGGIIIVMLIMIIVLKSLNVFPVLVMLFFGLLGFCDDYIKVSKKHNLGLRVWQKLLLQIIAAGVISVYAGLSKDIGTAMIIPFAGIEIDFGIWFYPITFIAVVAVTNAVNLTDGLDGLASGVTAIVMIFFGLTAIGFQSSVPAVFSGAVTGACLGFLRHNCNPADLFMGDTGSMALGGCVVAVAIMTKMQLFIFIAGFLYVLEALSVVLQVGYFKLSGGKRIFRMAPIHHHFELKGWSETRVVTVFWIITALSVFIAFAAL